ncbi:helix-hairpin-helix domain-containing protein [Arthrobacter gengyunqii]|uniref:Helix-hairpin-helix domain-containing protein n=1 Tax=Arthrobacter gengyunqii TaxID=2886940 RepID=A0A9X1M1E0_9MICC|nr:helix-hairpin-helix domain-containing protein [Arthrobacter gengyunqii]MCC3269162.1 helix-hairpin-helix domain-containing protein [Arthrobacter gengyunqii]UOY94878.1 helix-hairpin-helix domain-containing protein [Arthrobacter gengyunqii]
MAEHRWDTASSTATRTPRRRWLMSLRGAVLAVCLLIGLTAGVTVLRGGGTNVEVGSVELAEGGADSTAHPESGRDEGPEPEGPGVAGGHGTDGSVADRTDGGPGSETASPGTSDPAAAPSVLVVHVAGAVVRPGVVQVPSGSRAGDAVDAAGGTATDADLASVNLAAPLQDGMMVVVPRIGEPAGNPPPVSGPDLGAGTAGNGQNAAGSSGGGTTGSGGAGSPGALLNINSASLEELDSLPRIGPVIAQRIIDWREEHGSFSRPEDLDAVPGIGETMLAALLPLITV